MAVIELAKDVAEFFDCIDGETSSEKIVNLMDTNLLQRLHECEEEIYEFEVKHRMCFDDFKIDWEKGEVLNKHSYSVERDYMVWEGLEAEKKKWLSLMKKFEGEKSRCFRVS